jgi:hypothetical protein
MTRSVTKWRVLLLRRSRRYAAAISLGAIAMTATPSLADEGGVSFWIPGTFGSLAAVPGVPGWALAIVNYYASVGASGSVAVAREVTIGGLNSMVRVSLNANLRSNADVVFINPSYVFATPVFGGQFALSMTGVVGGNDTDVSGTLTATAGPLVVMRQGTIENGVTGFGDLYPQATLRWNSGVNNWMIYAMGDIPTGEYSSTSVANLGIGHGAIDGGGGYTYFNPQTGHEFSIVTGVTGNFTNPSTGYTNGIDWHVDWAASQFLTKQLQVGVVGYLYDQLAPDNGCNPLLCPFESRVAGVGPQIGYLFPVGNMQGYVNLKAYWEFAAQNRPDGWNAWLTFSLSPARPNAASPPVVTK